MNSIEVKPTVYNLSGLKMTITLSIKSDSDFSVTGKESLDMVNDICKAVKNIMENYSIRNASIKTE